MNNIITLEEARTLARPIGKIADEKLQAFIQEAEDLFIRPVIGDPLYIELIADSVDEKYDLLLNGGVYTKTDNPRILKGMKVALAYYVYGKVVMSGDVESTRFGMVVKNGEYSSKLTGANRSSVYNDVFEIANNYLNECLDYAEEEKFFGNSCGCGRRNRKRRAAAGGITIRKI